MCVIVSPPREDCDPIVTFLMSIEIFGSQELWFFREHQHSCSDRCRLHHAKLFVSQLRQLRNSQNKAHGCRAIQPSPELQDCKCHAHGLLPEKSSFPGLSSFFGPGRDGLRWVQEFLCCQRPSGSLVLTSNIEVG